MQKFFSILLLIVFLAAPACVVAAPGICDFALETGKYVDWFVCLVFASLFWDYQSDNFGNGTVR